MLVSGGTSSSPLIWWLLIDIDGVLRDQSLELKCLNGLDSFPGLAAGAVPDESLGTVATTRTSISRARQRELAQAPSNSQDRLFAIRLRQLTKMIHVDQGRHDIVVKYEIFDVVIENLG